MEHQPHLCHMIVSLHAQIDRPLNGLVTVLDPLKIQIWRSGYQNWLTFWHQSQRLYLPHLFLVDNA